ncbi:MAG: hypothetical protein ACOC7R_00970 [Planctomycetota bacterium]
MKRSRVTGAFLALAVALVARPAPTAALVIHGDTDATVNPLAYTQRPADDPGWDYIGATGAGTAVYLGNGYVLVPKHFTPGSTLDLPGGSFAFDSSFAPVDLTNPDPGEGTPDLRIFRILDAPALEPLSIRTTSPTRGGPPGRNPPTALILIACGRARNTELLLFGDFHGYATSTARQRAWGENTVSDNTSLATLGACSTYAFRSAFDETFGDAQAVQNDSGSGAFTFNPDAGRWELAGAVVGVVACDADLTRALIGNQVIMADLSIYRDQINAIVSEPIPDPVPGDADGDGDVDLDDFVILKTNFGCAANATWAMGDFDGDGDVDLDDFVLLKANFGITG